MANVLAVFAQFERRLIAERTKAALAIKRARGVRLGRPASIPDELAKRIVRMRERGLTLQAICDRLGPVSSWTSRGEGMAPAISESCLGPEDRAQTLVARTRLLGASEHARRSQSVVRPQAAR
jgi:Resolvase, N terminal domain